MLISRGDSLTLDPRPQKLGPLGPCWLSMELWGFCTLTRSAGAHPWPYAAATVTIQTWQHQQEGRAWPGPCEPPRQRQRQPPHPFQA